MADQPDRPDESPEAAVPPAAEPAKKPPAAKKATPAKKAANKTPAKKTPAKKAAAKKAPAKKAPAKKAPAKKAAPAKRTPPPAASLPPTADEVLNSAAKEAAAHAKSTVATAADVSGPPVHGSGGDVPVKPIAAALITGLLAILAVAWVARRGGD